MRITTTSAKKNIQSQSKPTASKQHAFQFVDKRPEAAVQRKLIHASNQHSDQQLTQRKPAFINDDSKLEKEADVMGEKAMQLKSQESTPKYRATSPTGSTSVVQRFTVLNPNQYQKAGLNQGNMFPSNQLDTSITSNRQGGIKSTTANLKWVERLSNNPPLKVSENGLLALESTVGQPRVFYGESGKVQSFRQRLINIKSRITLQEVGGSTVTTPTKPVNPDGQTHDLVQVEPVRNAHIPATEDLMNNSVCSDVSSKIVGGKELVIGGRKGSEKVLRTVGLGSTGRFGKILSNLHERGTTDPQDFAQELENDQDPINVNDVSLPISEEVRKYFAHGFPTRDHLMPSQQVLRALSIQGVPKKMWKQVFELYVGKTAQERPEEDLILNHIKGYFSVQNTISYRRAKENQQLKTNLGINERTSPEVGESFSTFSQIAPGTVDEYGVTGHGVDLSNMNNDQLKTLIDRFLKVKSSAKELGQLAKSQYEKTKGLVQFGDHHAAVVAKDGSDTITFENYNRGEESNTLQSELWEKWFSRNDEFNQSITIEVRDMLNEIRTHEENPNHNNFDKQFMVLRSKKQALKEFQKDFVNVTDKVRAKLDKNIEEDMNSLWHFNMYGPANQTFTDEKGKTQGQSFHDTWSKSVPNALTLRTTSLINDQMKGNLRKKVYHLLYQMVIGDNFANPLSSYDPIKDILLQNIEIPKTRIEYSDTLIALQEQEATHGVLNPNEQFEAEALFSGKKQLIFTALFLLKGPGNAAKKIFFDSVYRGDDDDDGWD